MDKQRLETISDGIFAIIITVMLLELKVPHGDDFYALRQELPLLFSYILSFIYVGTYWNNHHHLFRVVSKINGKTLWVNLHLMFWLTMIPFTTAWTAYSDYAAVPTASYAFILFMSSLSYRFLEGVIVKFEGPSSLAAKLLGNDEKLLISVVLYATSIGLSFINTTLTLLCLAILAALWFVPNKKIERYFERQEDS